MIRRRYVIILGVFVIAVATAATWQFWPQQPKSKGTTIHLAKDTKSGANNVTELSTNASLGQGNATEQQTPSTSPSSSSNNTNYVSTDNSQAQQALNPATFGQYDATKYKDGTSAFYADLLAGTGATVAMNQKVAVYYKGWLTNGTLFDESKPGSNGQLQPFVFTYGTNPSQVIPGFEEGIDGMKVGGV